MIINPRTQNLVYVESTDEYYIFNNFNRIKGLLVERNQNSKNYITVGNNRVFLGEIVNDNQIYRYALIKNMNDIANYLGLLFVIFLVLLIWGTILNYYNSKNIMKSVLVGIDEITNSANQIKGKNLEKRININCENKSIKNLIITLNSMLDRVEDSFIKINEFTGDVSHELKTPLMSIKTLIEVELVNERTKEEYQEDLIKILEEINWLDNIIQKLLVFNRNPSTIVDYFKPVKIENMVTELYEFMELLAVEKNIKLSCEIKDTQVEILGDEALLRDIFYNLMSNAIKYNKNNGSVTVSVVDEADRIGIKIKDTGIGIKKENIKKITERFFREDKVRTTKKSGSGLGLSIVSHLVELHKGSMEIESKEGSGSNFTVYFPKVKKIL